MGNVREFDQVDDRIILSGTYGNFHSASNGFTFLLVQKALAFGGADASFGCIAHAAGTSDAIGAIYQHSATVTRWGSDDPPSDDDATIAPVTGTWSILASTVAAGTSTPIIHYGALGGALSHANCASSVAAATTPAAGRVILNCFSDLSLPRGYRCAVCAIFTTNLSNATLDSISVASTTASLAAAGAVEIFEFTQASTATSVVGLNGIGTQSALVGTTVISGDDPVWTYGLAAAAAPVMTPSFQAIPFMGGH